MESAVPEVNTLIITHIVDNMHFLIYLYSVDRVIGQVVVISSTIRF